MWGKDTAWGERDRGMRSKNRKLIIAVWPTYQHSRKSELQQWLWHTVCVKKSHSFSVITQ